VNRAFTTLSYGGTQTGLYGDGQAHPGLGVTRDGKEDGSDCISDPNSKRFMKIVGDFGSLEVMESTPRMKPWQLEPPSQYLMSRI
jgi:hypothetical protein